MRSDCASRSLGATLFIVLLFALPAPLYARCYTVTDIGVLTGADSSVARAINESTQVAGEAWIEDSNGDVIESRAFRWDPIAGIVLLGTLGGVSTEVYDMNNAGTVVGSSELAQAGVFHAYVWTATGGMTDLGTFGGEQSIAQAINNSGQVVGQSEDGDGYWHAFLWTQAAGIKDLGTLGGQGAVAAAINDDGDVFGWSATETGAIHPFLWTADDGMIDLGPIFGDDFFIDAMNDNRDVAGDIATGDVDNDGNPTYHALLYTDGQVYDLGTLGGLNSSSYDVNNLGESVGYAEDDNGDAVAFIEDATDGMQNLNDALPRSTTWDLVLASAINDAGEIVGWGYHGNAARAFLLTPSTRDDNGDGVPDDCARSGGFACGTGLAPVLPLMAAGLLGLRLAGAGRFGFARRRGGRGGATG